MMDRERRLSEENAIFEQPEGPQSIPTDQSETATDEINRKESKLPHGGVAPEYEDEDVDETMAGGLRYPDEQSPSSGSPLKVSKSEASQEKM